MADEADQMRASVRESPPLIVVDLTGAVTALAEGRLIEAFGAALRAGSGDVLLNFAGVDYVNSAGIAIMLEVLAQAREAGRRLLLTGLTAHYRKIFQMMGLSQYAPLYDSEEAARQAVSRAVSEPPTASLD